MRCMARCLVIVAFTAACSKSGDSKPNAGQTSSTPSAKGGGGETSAAVHMPAAGTFQVDPTHSTILFKVHHEGAGYVYGWFKDFSGTFTIDSDPSKSHVELAVQAASIDTRDDERNGNLTGPDFLNAKQFPELTFKSKSVAVTGAGWHITGDLTIRGITKSVAFDAAPVGDVTDPHGKRLVGLEAHLSIARDDFGVSFMPEMVGPQVELIIDLEGSAA